MSKTAIVFRPHAPLHSPHVSSELYRVRRATLDDLPALRELWTKVNLPLQDLEKRFTEIQIAETQDGKIAGAIGVKVERLHGQIHSEAILDPTDTLLYEALWQRMQILSRNYGLFRMWTDSTNPYWKSLGFKAPSEKELEKIPSSLASAPAKALTYALKEESAEGLSVEQQFELFTQTQKLETERLMQQAQTFRKVAYFLLFLAFGGLILAAVIRFLKLPQKTKKTTR